ILPGATVVFKVRPAGQLLLVVLFDPDVDLFDTKFFRNLQTAVPTHFWVVEMIIVLIDGNHKHKLECLMFFEICFDLFAKLLVVLAITAYTNMIGTMPD